MTELKPCPFCGGEAKLIYFNGKANVCCPTCLIATKVYVPHSVHGDVRLEAITAWNRRAEV